ncbi:MAG TPA: hypothetical protein VM934_09435 [Pyrinomonadaceae bacterium]|nr:hypothetical protein [Pyrinomonadaceae bacterium]
MNPFKRLVAPRLPSAALGLSTEGASVVSLDRRRDVYAVRRAGYVPLPEGTLRPGFDDTNVANPQELAETLAELIASAGMSKHRRWSVALPEAATRTSILTLESATSSRGETEEMLRWKTERVLAAPLDELRISRERLSVDSQGRARYLVTAIRLSVLDEYESVFESLGWHTGLILPRHMGEAWWLTQGPGGLAGVDSLLVSTHLEGFTAVVLRGSQPLLVRGVICDVEDRSDELYRFLLYYRDRNAPAPDEAATVATPPLETIERLLVAGSGLDYAQASAIVGETLSVSPRPLRAEDVRLSFPSNEIDFNLIAAPAGLAALAWA